MRPSTYNARLPASPAATVITITQKKWMFPLAAMMPDRGMMMPAGNPGRFRYSRNTITNMAIAPYLVK